MRLLHTSDWHIGRSLHGTDLLAEQEAVLGGLAGGGRRRAGRRRAGRGRRLRPRRAVGRRHGRARPGASPGCCAAGAAVVLTPGNHDSARRLGTFSGLLAAAGLHVRAATAALDEPVLLADEHGDVAVYGLPYLEPEVARHELGLAGAPRAATRRCCAAAMDRVRADLFLRPGRPLGGARARVRRRRGAQRERARHLRRRGRPGARRGVRRRRLRRARPPAPAADAHPAAALQRLPAGLLLRRGRAAEAGLAGRARRAPAWPTCGRSRCRCRGRSRVLTGDARRAARRPGARARSRTHFVSARLTDAGRGPTDPMRRLQARFPHCVHLEWAGGGAPRRRPQLPGAAARPQRPRRSPASSSGTSRGVAAPARPSGSCCGRALARRRPRGGRPMRLHRLSLTAFGPFAGTVEVDLDEVGRDGLFLLWGPTGAGKTTLLDAVVLRALRHGARRARRGEAAAQRPRRRRRPHRGRAASSPSAASGCGSSGAPSSSGPRSAATGLDHRAGQAHRAAAGPAAAGSRSAPASTRAREHLRTRLGLSADQFCQVVLLPQGDFARFLRAEPEDRGRLLRTLFDVGRFARVEDWLAERAGGAPASALDGVRRRMSTLLARVAQIADVDVPEELAPELVGAAARRPRGAAGSPRVRARRPPTGWPRRRPRPPRPPPGAAPVDAELAAARAARRPARPPRPRPRASWRGSTAARGRAGAAARRARRRPPGRAAARRPGGRRPRRARGRAGAAEALDAARRAWAPVADGRDGRHGAGPGAARRGRRGRARCCPRWTARPTAAARDRAGWTARSRTLDGALRRGRGGEARPWPGPARRAGAAGRGAAGRPPPGCRG